MNKEINFDNLIKSEIQKQSGSRHDLEPSAGFVEKTMARIYKIDRRRRLMAYTFALLTPLIPIVIRQVWMFARGNNFDVGRWPLGNYIATAYLFFISSAGLYLFLILGIGISFFFVQKVRRESNSSVRIA